MKITHAYDYSDNYFMGEAIKEAVQASQEGEVPIGAVVCCNNKIIGRGHNLTERLQDVTAHAEILALTAAANFMGSKYLKDCSIYVTVEPCVMCAGALYWSQVKRIIFGASDPKGGFTRLNQSVIHPRTYISKGIAESECSRLIKDFFFKKRNSF